MISRFRNQITSTVQYTQTYLQEAVNSKTASRSSRLKGRADSGIKQCNQIFSTLFLLLLRDVVVVVVVVVVGRINCFRARTF